MGGRGSSGGRTGGGGSISTTKASKNTANNATEYMFEKSELEQLPLNILREMKYAQVNKSNILREMKYAQVNKSRNNDIAIQRGKKDIQIDEFIIRDKQLNAEEKNRSLYKGEIEPYIERMKQNKKKLAQARKDAKVLHSNIVHIERQIKKKSNKKGN